MVSIHRPTGYGPVALPLRHSAYFIYAYYHLCLFYLCLFYLCLCNRFLLYIFFIIAAYAEATGATAEVLAKWGLM